MIIGSCNHAIIGLVVTGGPCAVQECLPWRSIDPLTDGILSDERFVYI